MGQVRGHPEPFAGYIRKEVCSYTTDPSGFHLLRSRRSSDPIKCAETLQKLISLHRSSGTQTQLIQTLSLLLPSSPLHPILAGLPPLDPTNPSVTSAVIVVQEAMVDSLRVLEEIVLLTETEEAARFEMEFKKRRMRLDASGPEQIKKAVGREIWATSQVSIHVPSYPVLSGLTNRSFQIYTTKSLITPIRQTTSVEPPNQSCSATNKPTSMLYQPVQPRPKSQARWTKWSTVLCCWVSRMNCPG
jgi:hypothetical protein